MRESLLFYILKEVQPLSPSSILDLFPPPLVSPYITIFLYKENGRKFWWMNVLREKTHLFFSYQKKKKNISLPLSDTHTRRGKKKGKFLLILFIPFLWVWGEPPPQSRKGIYIIYVVFYSLLRALLHLCVHR